jgi:hypothetical protein
MENNRSLGFSTEWLVCDSISPFVTAHPVRPVMPANLKPTALQLTVEHHPWIDLWPFPQMRDNILRAGESYDDDPLWIELVDNQLALGGWSGLIVWGNPWDVYSWEVTEEFARRWWWVIRDCVELFISTNRWRAKRGERKLFAVADTIV